MLTGNIGGIQGDRRPEIGSARSPLLFVAVVEVISRKTITKNILHKLCSQSTCMTVVADSETDSQEQLVEYVERDFWQAWTESKTGEDAGALGRAAEQISKY